MTRDELLALARTKPTVERIETRLLWRDGRLIYSKVTDDMTDLAPGQGDGVIVHVSSYFVPRGAADPLATERAAVIAYLEARAAKLERTPDAARQLRVAASDIRAGLHVDDGRERAG